MSLFVVLAACGAGSGGACPECAPPTDGVAPPDDEPVRTAVVTGPCATEPGLAVAGALAIPGPNTNDAQISLHLTEEAAVAVLCTSDEDPADQHLVESGVASRTHSLRVQGLRPEEPYTCRAAPTCPVMGDYPIELSFTTGAPPSLPRLEVTVDPALGMTGYWTLLPYEGGGGCGGTSHLAIYDADGVPRWWYRLPQGAFVDVEALWHPEDRTIVWGGGWLREGAARVVDLWEGDTYVTPSWPRSVYHHDAKRLPDGRILTLEEADDRWGPYYEWTGFAIRAHDPATGTLSLDVHSQRYVDEGWLRFAGGAWWDTDPYHANWMDLYEDPVEGDVLYVSLCNDRSILALDAATGDVRWKLDAFGGWTALDPTGAPAPERFALPQCAHGLEVLGRDVLLVYDNGADRSFSQVTELHVDAAAREVRVGWQWWEPGWHEGSLGDVDDLGNGRVLVTMGHPECWSESPGDRSAVVEVDRATGRVASRLELPDPDGVLYRAERYDGCALFSSVEACPALGDRARELGAWVGW